MTVWVLLPAFNEQQAIGYEIKGICEVLARQRPRVVVVDDGSRDRTAALAESMSSTYPVEVLRHATNRGLGEALTTGLRHILREGKPADAVVFKDADATHPVSLVPTMLKLLDGGSEVIVASRYRRGARQCGLSRARKLLSLLANGAYSLAAHVPGVRDYTCGFRVFRLAALERAARRRELIEVSGFGATAELLLKVSAAGARVTEVPFVLRYDRKAGPSKMRALRAGSESLGVLWRRS